MRLTFLGTGTSHGVPYVGCDCEVCRSPDPLNKRLRCSVLVDGEATGAEGRVTRLLVDTTPDLRQQLLREHVNYLSRVLWTHSHNDHVIGLDDLRSLCDRMGGYIDCYGDAATIAHLERIFDYAFVLDREYGGFPRLHAHVLGPDETLQIGDIRVCPVPILHGKREIYAYRFECGGRVLVYATDCSQIPDTSWELMKGADVLVLDALRRREHPTHFSVEQALAAIRRLQPGRALLTHIAHDLDHTTTNRTLPAGVELAYDTLSLNV
jgi:phosphoribosyl 1,2-cyclic phosphate phosphodiesterase